MKLQCQQSSNKEGLFWPCMGQHTAYPRMANKVSQLQHDVIEYFCHNQRRIKPGRGPLPVQIIHLLKTLASRLSSHSFPAGCFLVRSNPPTPHAHTHSTVNATGSTCRGRTASSCKLFKQWRAASGCVRSTAFRGLKRAATKEEQGGRAKIK